MNSSRMIIVITGAILFGACTLQRSMAGDGMPHPSSVQTLGVIPSPTPYMIDKDSIARCISEASSEGMPLREMGDLRTHSLKGDFDGNGKDDIAVLVSSDAEPGKGGLLVCRNGDRKQLSKFGSLFKPAKPLSSFDEDNFITTDWEVILKDESPKIALGPDGKSRIMKRNKGDIISFFHEGGAVFIFWDGEVFTLVEGG